MNTAMSLIGKGPLWSCIVVGFFQPNAAAKTCEHLVDDSLHSASSEVPMLLVVGTTCKHISEVKWKNAGKYRRGWKIVQWIRNFYVHLTNCFNTSIVLYCPGVNTCIVISPPTSMITFGEYVHNTHKMQNIEYVRHIICILQPSHLQGQLPDHPRELHYTQHNRFVLFSSMGLSICSTDSTMYAPHQHSNFATTHYWKKRLKKEDLSVESAAITSTLKIFVYFCEPLKTD